MCFHLLTGLRINTSNVIVPSASGAQCRLQNLSVEEQSQYPSLVDLTPPLNIESHSDIS